MIGAIATHYADALARAVFAENAGLEAQTAVEQLGSIDQLISGSRELKRALQSPAIKKDKKTAVLSALAEQLGLHRLVKNFVLVIVAHRRTNQLSAIRQEFEAAVDRRLGWVPAEITSAQNLAAGEKEQIEQALSSQLGKQIRASYNVDATLLAGVRARVASKEYDATLRGKLEGLRQKLGAGR